MDLHPSSSPMNPETISLLNSLKGPAASILWALVFNGKPINRQRLVAITGYGRNTLTRGLRTLEELELIEYYGHNVGWYLTGALATHDLPGLQVRADYCDEDDDEEFEADYEDEDIEEDYDDDDPVIIDAEFLPPHSPEDRREVDRSPYPDEDFDHEVEGSPQWAENHPSEAEKFPPGFQIPGQGEKISPPAPTEKSRKAKFSPRQTNIPPDEAENSPQSVNNVVVESHTLTQREGLKTTKRGKRAQKRATRPSPGQDDDLDPRLRRALLSVGLVLNKRVRALARLPHVTPRYVRAHAEQLKAQGLGSHTGLLVTILESGAAAPDTFPNGHLKSCLCDTCIQKYHNEVSDFFKDIL